MRSSAHCAAPNSFFLGSSAELTAAILSPGAGSTKALSSPRSLRNWPGIFCFLYCMVPKCCLYFVHCVCKPKRSIDPRWCFLSSFHFCAIRGSVFSLLCVALHVRKSLGANRISHVKSLLLSFLSGSTPAEFSGKHARFHQGE